MPDLKHLNARPLNQAAAEWMKGDLEPGHLAFLQLAEWGLANRAEGEWPANNRHALQQQMDGLFGWKAENAMAWLLSNPEAADDPQDQESELAREVENASDRTAAAAIVLNAIYSRQVSQNPALQPSTSELS